MSFDLGNPKDYFQISGRMREFRPLKIGHIHDTWISWWEDQGQVKGYIHQKINANVFKDIETLMNNMNKVTAHVHEKIVQLPLSKDRIFGIVPTLNNRLYYDFGNQVYWRTLEYLENTESFFICESETTAFQAAACCARFIDYLSDLPANELQETIPDFHNPRKRFDRLTQVVDSNPMQRVEDAAAEIDFAEKYKEIAFQIVDAKQAGALPLRVTHNDLKFNNVLFDCTTKKAVAVIDLDTCMPGTIPDDFGDFIRNTCIAASEDEVDLAKIFINLDLYSAACKGFLQIWSDKLEPEEKELLPIAPAVLALTLGVRFLTDFLEGDRYFKTQRSKHNLDRARAQFKVLESILSAQPEMRKIFKDYLV